MSNAKENVLIKLRSISFVSLYIVLFIVFICMYLCTIALYGLWEIKEVSQYMRIHSRSYRSTRVHHRFLVGFMLLNL